MSVYLSDVRRRSSKAHKRRCLECGNVFSGHPRSKCNKCGAQNSETLRGQR